MKIIHYFLLKKKCEKLLNNHSRNYSYDANYDKFEKRFKFTFKIPKDAEKCNKYRAEQKDLIIKNYLNLNKIVKNIENISLMFYDYCKALALEINSKKKENFNNLSKFGNQPRETNAYANINEPSILKNNYSLLEKTNFEINENPNFKTSILNINTEGNVNCKFNNKFSIINSKMNTHLIVKIGHMIINCENIGLDLNKEYPQNLFQKGVRDVNKEAIMGDENDSKDQSVSKNNGSALINFEEDSKNIERTLIIEDHRKSKSINDD